jgi:hypothetical protein
MKGKVLRRFAAVGVVCATAFAATAGVASADKPGGPGPGACPNDGFVLTALINPLPSIDKNDNGWYCLKQLPGGSENAVDDNSHSN